MKRLDKCMLGLYGILYIIIGIILSLMQGDFLTKTELIKYLGLSNVSDINQVFWTILGSLICLSGISIINIVLVNREDRKAVVFKTEKGEVRITLSAIEEFIKKSLVKMNEVKDIKSKITARPKFMKIQTRVILNSDIGISDIVGKVQKEIQENIKNMLGIDFKIKVDVNVIKMTSSKDVVIDVCEKQETVSEISADIDEDSESENIIEQKKETFNGIQY